MNNTKKILTLIVCICVLFSLAGCGEKEECTEVVQEFESACNELDIDAMLDYINPKVSEPIQLTLAMVNMAADIQIEDVIQQVGNTILDSTGDISVTELFNSMDLEVTKFKQNGKEATVNVDISFVSLGVEMKEYGVITMIKVDDEWYISNFKFVEK